MDIKNIIGNNIRSERVARNISTEELAEMLRLSPAFVGLIERGQRGTSIKNILKISQIFSIPIDLLVQAPSSPVVAESQSLKVSPTKKDKINSMLFDLNDHELDFILSMIKNLRQLKSTNDYDCDTTEDDYILEESEKFE